MSEQVPGNDRDTLEAVKERASAIHRVLQQATIVGENNPIPTELHENISRLRTAINLVTEYLGQTPGKRLTDISWADLGTTPITETDFETDILPLEASGVDLSTPAKAVVAIETYATQLKTYIAGQSAVIARVYERDEVLPETEPALREDIAQPPGQKEVQRAYDEILKDKRSRDTDE